MIIDSTGSNKITIGETKEYKTSIDVENLDFIATLLSSNLYSNPEDSFIREIVSNGWDSHVEAGTTDTPLVVRFKYDGSYSYNITIRDYGTGLSKEQFENIYCKIGTSTKRSSNNYLGCFGIGKFATMAVSKVAYITSYYNGVARLYIMTKDGNSITTNLMSETPTSEKNGLEITVKNILHTFRYEEAFKNLAFFPNVYIDGTFSEYNNIKVKRYKYFTATTEEFSNKLLLGNVLYPLDRSIIPAELREFYDSVVKSGVVFNFNIGELQVTPNRESIIYNTQTNNLIIQRIKDAKEEMTSILKPFMERDYDNPYTYWSLKRQAFCFNFVENKIHTDIYSCYIPVFKINMFPFKLTLNGKNINDIQLISYLRSHIPNIKAIVTRDRVYKEDKTWNARRLINEQTKIIIVPPSLKLSQHLKNYLVEHYYNYILITPTSLQEYKQAYINAIYRQTGFTNDEDFIIEACYKQLISRSTSIDFDSDSAFIAFKEAAKAEARANKVPANTGKVILNVYLANKSNWDYRKREFSSYAKALEFIKELKGGTLYKNLDDLSIASTATSIGYNVISANKKVLEWLSKENFTSRITENTVFNNKKIILLKALIESKLPTTLGANFINSLTPRLKKLASEAIKTYNSCWDFSVNAYLEKVQLDEVLLKDLLEIKNCYDIYKRFAEISELTTGYGGTNIKDLLYYVIMKQKGYRLNPDCYKQLKQNKLLSLICKK